MRSSRLKAIGAYLRCAPRPFFKVAIYDPKEATSSSSSWNMKSPGKRPRSPTQATVSAYVRIALVGFAADFTALPLDRR